MQTARAGPPTASSFCLPGPQDACCSLLDSACIAAHLLNVGSDWSLHRLPWRRGQGGQAWPQDMGHCNSEPLCSHKEQSQAPEPGLESSTPGPPVSRKLPAALFGRRVCAQLLQVAVPRGPTPRRLGVRIASFSDKDKGGTCR